MIGHSLTRPGNQGCSNDAPGTAPRSIRHLGHKWRSRNGSWTINTRASTLTNTSGSQMIRVPTLVQSIKSPTDPGSPDLGRFILNYLPGDIKYTTVLTSQTRQFEIQRLPIFNDKEQMRDFLEKNGMMNTVFRREVAMLMSKWFRHSGEASHGPNDLIEPFTAIIDHFIETWAMGLPLGRQHVLRVMSCVLHGALLWTCDGYNSGHGLGISQAQTDEDSARADLLDQYIRDAVWSDDQVEEVLQRFVPSLTTRNEM